jgi:hypothetical protein
LYNKATCFEFHQLLVATLLSYGKTLDDLDSALHKKKPDLQRLVRIVDEVWTCASLLWSIAYSRALENHLETLRHNGWLALPVNGKLSDYRDFTKFTGLKKQEIITADKDKEDGDGGDEWGSSMSDNPAGIAGEDGEGVQEGEEIRALYADKKPVGLADIYHRWIRLQVDRWHAARKITSSLVRSPNPVDLTLLAVRYTSPRLATSVMNPWSSTISDLCKGADIHPEPVIDALRDRIRREVQHPDCNPIFKQFNPNPTKEIMYTGRVHCEAALASLLKYPGSEGDDDDLKKRLKVWSPRSYRHCICQFNVLHRIAITAQSLCRSSAV